MNKTLAATGATLTALALTGCGASGTTATTTKTTTAATVTSYNGANALAAATALPTKGRAPKTGYTRLQFGQAWTDSNGDLWGHNGCDTRDDVLKRDLTNVTFRDSKHCEVKTGTLRDQYTGKTITFTRGVKTSAAVQIDHAVALSDAWQTGANTWTTAKRTDYANDPLVLMSSDGPANEAKGDGDAATWLPSNKAFRPCYVAHQVAIKRKYGLWVTPAEKAAMVKVLASAPTMKLPTEPGGLTCN